MFVFFFHIPNENFTILGMRDYLFFFCVAFFEWQIGELFIKVS